MKWQASVGGGGGWGTPKFSFTMQPRNFEDLLLRPQRMPDVGNVVGSINYTTAIKGAMWNAWAGGWAVRHVRTHRNTCVHA